jgi:DNA polymerase I-like protein with 3'-5' exonuclease and polymerase domains
MLSELEMYCASRKVTKIASTNTDILSKLLEREGNTKSNPKLSDYAGSLFSYKNLEVVFIPPLRQLFTVPYGKFIAARFISKVAAPEAWEEPSDFKWDLLNESNVASYYEQFKDAYAIAVDIETLKNPLSIRCIGYTAIHLNKSTNVFTTISVVLPVDSAFALAWMRKINVLEAPKIFQNGKYDNAYLLRYNSAPRNWFWDTAHLFHSWHSELPKDLAFLNAFFLRKVVYWKDLAETNDLQEYYRYNALDTWATANVWIQQMRQMPDWAVRNYILEFPLVYPCLLSEMTGLLRDSERLETARKDIDSQVLEKLVSLRKMLGCPEFNPNSPKQVLTLLKILGCGDLTSSDETNLQKASFRHPLNARILTLILDIRGLKKLKGTYLRTDEDAKQTGIHAGEGGSKDFSGTFLYSLNPHHTGTGRLASGEHAFWCGANVQNQPRGPEVKQTLRAPDEFYIGECDLEQAESRDTAYISGEEKMIDALSSGDFHSKNASMFFGIPYNKIYDEATGKVLNKPVRQLAKPVNHGANYNMTGIVLVDTMGLPNIYLANKLLSLGLHNPIEIANTLLGRFHITYSKLKGTDTPFSPGTYYASVVQEITTTKKLVSRAFHHTEYNLSKYTPAEYIKQGFYEVALPYADSFRLHAQIHDSILFSYSQKRKELPEMVRQRMEIPVSVRDVSGVTRTFTVPTALKIGKPDSPAIYWSETE